MARHATTEEEADIGLTTEQLAATAYRAFEYASQREPLAWGLVSEAARVAWRRVASQAPAILEQLAGKRFRDAGERLCDAAAGDAAGDIKRMRTWEPGHPTDADWLDWEAVARHLTAVLDEAEIDDLPALEASWGPWAKKRLEK